jgi:hypothetical protein
MNNDKFKAFQQKYPNLFKEYPRSGFALDAGWESLVHSLCIVLEHHIVQLPEEVRKNICCAQVKEKFGGLRFYMTQETPYIDGAIAMAESMSFHTCDKCGAPGERRSGGWIRTLCETHASPKESSL